MIKLIASILAASLAFSSFGAASVAKPSNVTINSANLYSINSQVKVAPAFWGAVIKILTTKTACENALRIMPGKKDLKCQKAGKVWVIIPKDVF